MSKDRQWVFLSLSLMLLGALIIAYKVVYLGFPGFPDQSSDVWTVQVRLELQPEGGPVKASLLLPSRPSGFALSSENFISRRFGLTVDEDLFRRQADWAIRDLAEAQSLYYRVIVLPDSQRSRIAPRPAKPVLPELEEPYATALTDIIEQVQSESADVESFSSGVLDRINKRDQDENMALFLVEARSTTDRLRVAQTILAGAGMPSLMVNGIRLAGNVQRASIQALLAVYDGEDWLLFDPVSGQQGVPSDFMIWWRGDEVLATSTGAQINDLQISIRQARQSTLELASQRAGLERSRLAALSLINLPVQTQSVYELLLLVPFGVLLIVVLRNVVGLSSFGTFAPVLIALAFRETELLKGILLFTLIVSLGLFFRFYLERLRLLLVPRLAAVVTIVVLLMTTISLISHQMGAETGLSISLFPMVIISMVIERMSVVWEERGAPTAIREGIGSLMMAALAYLVMAMDILSYWVTVFPECNLIVLGLIVALGRYTGLRLTELNRFKTLAGRGGGH